MNENLYHPISFKDKNKNTQHKIVDIERNGIYVYIYIYVFCYLKQF